MTKASRPEQLEQAARARAAITSFFKADDRPYVTVDVLQEAVEQRGIKGVNVGNVVARMASNHLLTQTSLDKPHGRHRVGYSLPRTEDSPTPNSTTKPTRKRAAHVPTEMKPTVIVTKNELVIEFSTVRVIVQLEPR